jgi:MFS transporter, DHA2 family, multidrug resistance protein
MGVDGRATGTGTNVGSGSTARSWSALAAIMLAVLAVSLDVTVLTVALPTLATALDASLSDLQWFTSGYALALAAGMLPAGLLGDRYGRKKVMLISLLLFGAGSIACVYSTSAGAFIAARAVLGAAGAGIIVMALSAITVLVPEEERPRAVGIWAAANFVALPLGPILGGWLLTHYWWGLVFLMNVPVAVLALVAVAALMPESRAAERPKLDVVGIVTFCGGLVGVTYGLIEAGRDGWTARTTLLPLAAGLVLLAAFVLWEWRLDRQPGGQPVVDLALFASRGFTWGLILMTMGLLAVFGALFALPQYFQAVLGVDPQGSGLRLLPVVAGLVLGAVPADRLAARLGARLTVAAGFALLAIGMTVGSLTSLDSGTGFVAAWTVVAGAGMGLSLSTAASTALSEIPEQRSGVASALLQAVQKLGAPFGAAILGSVLNSAYQSQLKLGGLPAPLAGVVRQSVFGGIAAAQRLSSPTLLRSVREAFVHGMDAALLVSAGIAVAGVILALLFLPGHAAGRAAAR